MGNKALDQFFCRSSLALIGASSKEKSMGLALMSTIMRGGFEGLIHLSYLLVNHPEIAELDINPLLVDSKRLLVLDSRMRLSLT